MPGVLLGKVGAGAAHCALRSRDARYALQLKDYVSPLQSVAARSQAHHSAQTCDIQVKVLAARNRPHPSLSERYSFPQGCGGGLWLGTEAS